MEVVGEEYTMDMIEARGWLFSYLDTVGESSSGERTISKIELVEVRQHSRTHLEL